MPAIAPPIIQSATAADIEAVAAIEALVFDRPWTVADYRIELRREIASLDVLRPAGSAEIVAFNHYWVVVDEAQVLKVATHPAHQRRGHGRALLDSLVARAPQLGVRMLTLEVRRSNDAARALYWDLGFREVGLRAGYYEGNEDAVLMTLDLKTL